MLCQIDCVTRVSYDPTAHGATVKLLKPADGTLGYVIGFGTDKALAVRIETTSRGPDQSALVAEYLRRL